MSTHLRRLCLCVLFAAALSVPAAYADDTKPAGEKNDAAEAAKKDDKPAPEEEKAQPAADKKEAKPAPANPAEKQEKPAPPKKDEQPEKNPAEQEKEAKPAAVKKDDASADKKDAGKGDEKKKAEPSKPKKKPKPAPTKVDFNRAYQGEFVGTVAVRPSKFRQIALQVRAAGSNMFEAAQFLGGLPSRPGNQPEPTFLIGRRSEDFLTLSGGPWAVLVHPDHCVLVDREGKRVGRLDRVHRKSPTLGAKPPKHAVVIFDGSDTENFTNARMTDDGLLMEGADFKPMFQDFNLHLEFRLPMMPDARGQGRANSGVYLQSRYELQVLDSFAIPKLKDGCGGLYKFREPDVNVCYPPEVWQTYDIKFTAPRWAADGTKLDNARITAWHNGVKIHNDVELPNKTGAGKPEEPTLLPIRLQNHGDPVRYRYIWLIDRGASPPTRFPVRVEK